MIEQLFDEALVNAVRRGDNRMAWKDVESARLTLQVGLGQPVGYTEHEKRLIATHEAGHATAAYLMAPNRRLEILSIIKRRDALGMLAHGDAEEVYTRSRSDMIGLIRIALGGQCAEELFFGDVSTGPAGDLLYATNVAAQMVGAAGMAGTLVSFAAIQGNAFSDTNIVGRVLADADGRRRVEELLQEQKVVVKDALEANQHLIAALRDALMEHDELVGKEIDAVLEAARQAGPPPAVIDLREGRAALAKPSRRARSQASSPVGARRTLRPWQRRHPGPRARALSVACCWRLTSSCSRSVLLLGVIEAFLVPLRLFHGIEGLSAVLARGRQRRRRLRSAGSALGRWPARSRRSLGWFVAVGVLAVGRARAATSCSPASCPRTLGSSSSATAFLFLGVFGGAIALVVTVRSIRIARTEPATPNVTESRSTTADEEPTQAVTAVAGPARTRR